MGSSRSLQLCALAFALVVAAGTAFARTISVPADYWTIQQAIDMAADGDEVVVAPGTYLGCINFAGKAITVKSTYETDPLAVAATIIDGDKKGSVVTFTSGETAASVLKGFTIVRGSGAPQTGGETLGGGVYCSNSSPTLISNTIRGNSATQGGGGVFCVLYASPTLTMNTIRGNSAVQGGGGVHCYYGSSPTLTNNTIRGNSGDLGGGVYCYYYSSPALSGNTIRDNSAGSSGGGVYCSDYSSPTLTNNTISGNSTLSSGSGTGGGGVYCSYSSPTLTSNSISGNVASWSGGGVYCDNGASPILTNNTISDNSANGTASEAGGGGVYCLNYSSPTLTNNTISGNAAGGGAGVFCRTSSSPTLTKNTISSNSASWLGGGVHCRDNSSPTLTNNTISGNAARHGGGVYCTNAAPTLANNVIRNNSATGSSDFSLGGGVYCWASSPTLTSNTISGNSASHGGGVTCEYSSPVVTNNLICGNSAIVGGGGVYCHNGASPILTNNTISGNTAGGAGGGVYCSLSSSPVIRNTIVTLSTQGGGLCVNPDPTYLSNPVVTYCDFFGNTGGNYVDFPDQTGLRGNISKAPLFHATGKGDFHLKSKGGRWDPVAKTWVVDTVHSPCIDAGHPKSVFAREPGPNGGRINMGAYGNTTYASKAAPVVPGSALVVTAAAEAAGSGRVQITVNLTAAAAVQVRVLNLAGREVAVLPQRELPQGVSSLLWEGKSKTGTAAPAGRYLVRVEVMGGDGGHAQALAGLSLAR